MSNNISIRYKLLRLIVLFLYAQIFPFLLLLGFGICAQDTYKVLSDFFTDFTQYLLAFYMVMQIIIEDYHDRWYDSMFFGSLFLLPPLLLCLPLLWIWNKITESLFVIGLTWHYLLAMLVYIFMGI